eukprot:GHVU01164552.1.p1 GENE.GHVU01164552.1~~GHVU01164552.1.p1  ORF type:complete len:232 (+),score=16.77 GHVU01164552.1:709-1404(+)
MDRVAADFQGKCGIAGVVGAIDCTHVAIQKPPTDQHQYFNRKGVRTLNVQATCDLAGYFTSVLVKYAGSTHDSFILQRSAIWTHLEVRRRPGILLGDSGYPTKPWLLTPYPYPPTGRRQRLYNKRFCGGRVIIENVFGRVKRRFGILKGGLRIRHDRIPVAITACFVLHNIVKRLHVREEVYGDPDPPLTEDDEPQPPNVDLRVRQSGGERDERTARGIRDAVRFVDDPTI